MRGKGASHAERDLEHLVLEHLECSHWTSVYVHNNSDYMYMCACASDLLG